MKLVFYTLYRWFHGWNSPELSAMYLLGIVAWMLVINILQLIRIALGYQIFNLGKHFLLTFILFAIITLIIYFIYVRKRKFIEIDNYYSNKETFINTMGNIITVLYLLLTIVLFFGIPLVMNLSRQVA